MTVLLTVFLASPVSAQESVASSGLTDLQKEAITAIKEITLQLILISVGAFAIVGALLGSQERPYRYVRWIWASFLLFMVSIGLGLLEYGTLIENLIQSSPSPADSLGWFAAGQWVFFGLAGLCLAVFLLRQLEKGS